tara:strand:- start:68 stop:319 length:252 start_codon:yes stop_codon:yes gene_type:complete
MELPINYKDLDTIVQSLSLGGDARLYHLLKDIRDDERIERNTQQTIDFSEDPVIIKQLQLKETGVEIYAESDEYQCKQGQCDI